MKFVVPIIAAVLACAMPMPGKAEAADVERLREAMKSARWTGPLLASNAGRRDGRGAGDQGRARSGRA